MDRIRYSANSANTAMNVTTIRFVLDGHLGDAPASFENVDFESTPALLSLSVCITSSTVDTVTGGSDPSIITAKGDV